MTVKEIAAIPTRYDGVLFRSRTEARYAVFLDHLHIPWEYEPQGFDVGGEWYLPDFVTFPALGMLWIEVKGSWETAERLGKWRKFAELRPQPSRAGLLTGEPSVTAQVTVSDDANSPDGPWEDEYQWRPCPAGYHFDLIFPGAHGTAFAEDGCDPWSLDDGKQKIERAVATARSYRFGTGG